MKTTFSQLVKQEITVAECEAYALCCMEAACYGVACFGRSFDMRGVVLYTDSEFIAEWANSMYQTVGIEGKVAARGAGGFEFSVKDPYEVDKLLAMFSHSGDEPNLRIKEENLKCGGCFAAFLSAAFLCCGIVLNPEKSYTLEFISPRHRLMRDFAELLESHGFEPKRTLRNGANVLYFKASEQVEDLLITMGATQSALEIMNMKVYRDIRNRANRITNCETANIDKIITANRQTLDAIRLLEEHNMLSSLPPQLLEAAELRKAYPHLGLAELADLSGKAVSKSGLSHRCKKLREIASNIKERIKE